MQPIGARARVKLNNFQRDSMYYSKLLIHMICGTQTFTEGNLNYIDVDIDALSTIGFHIIHSLEQQSLICWSLCTNLLHIWYYLWNRIRCACAALQAVSHNYGFVGDDQRIRNIFPI